MAFPAELQEIGKTCFGCTDRSGKQDGNGELMLCARQEFDYFHCILMLFFIFFLKGPNKYPITAIFRSHSFITSRSERRASDRHCSLKFLLMKEPHKGPVPSISPPTEAPIRPQRCHGSERTWQQLQRSQADRTVSQDCQARVMSLCTQHGTKSNSFLGNTKVGRRVSETPRLTDPPQKELKSLEFTVLEVRVHGSRETQMEAVQTLLGQRGRRLTHRNVCV